MEGASILPKNISEKLPTKEIIVERFTDFRGKDLSTENFLNTDVNILCLTNFDTETKWPSIEKLPQGFNPEKLLEESKNPGLGIRELHKQGITGKGIVVAIIDQKLDVTHPEYKDSIINYSEYGTAKDEEISMHGPGVSSLRVGKDCGTALGSKLVYKALPSGRNFALQAQALNDIVEYNQNKPLDNQIRVVSCSIGYMESNPEPDLDKWIMAKENASKQGIFVVDVLGDKIGLSFTGGGSMDKDNFESYEPWLAEDKDEKDDEWEKIKSEGDEDMIFNKARELKKNELSHISDNDLREQIKKLLENRENAKNTINQPKQDIVVPSDYRTLASSWINPGQYMYNGQGGMSWSVPYLAGIYAMALQVDPNIQKEKLAEIIQESATINQNRVKVINPKKIIELVKNR